MAKFNLVYGNVKSDNFYRFSSDTKESREIRQFPLVVSNFSLATESSKIDHGKVLFGNFIDSIDSSFTEIKTLELLDQMLENTVLDISSVPCNTTVGVDIEQKVSSVFLPPFTIREGPMLGNFGTVSSSIILINWENEVCFYEVSRYPVVKTVVERFVIK